MTKSAFYDKFDYRAFWQNRHYEDQADQIALKRLLASLKGPRQRILDVGGGFGRNTLSFSQLWDEATLLDPSAKNLAEAKSYLKGRQNVQFIQGTAEKLPFPDNYFDTLVCIRVFHHLPQPKPAIKEFYRVLKPGGSLILEVANKVHAKARLSAILQGSMDQISSPEPNERRSEGSIKSGSISFVNHHPQTITKLLKTTGFNLEETLSVSNFRFPLTKVPILSSIFLFLEKQIQKPLSSMSFGPSIYFLATKPKV